MRCRAGNGFMEGGRKGEKEGGRERRREGLT